MAEHPDAADQNRRLNIRLATRRGVPATRKLRDVPLALGLPTIEELEEELFGYVDVLLGRQEPPLDAGLLSMMEIANAYLSRAMELDMMIHAGERDRSIMRSSPYYKLRTGELRTFIDLAKRCQELGSRRLTEAQLLADAERTGNEPGL
jgi:hypothetical protein